LRICTVIKIKAAQINWEKSDFNFKGMMWLLTQMSWVWNTSVQLQRTVLNSRCCFTFQQVWWSYITIYDRCMHCCWCCHTIFNCSS
jgi:hypothetical protein